MFEANLRFGRTTREELPSFCGSSVCFPCIDDNGKTYKGMKTDKIYRRCEICGYTEELIDTESMDEKTIKKIMAKADVRSFDEVELNTDIGEITVVACDHCIDKAKNKKIKSVFSDEPTPNQNINTPK